MKKSGGVPALTGLAHKRGQTIKPSESQQRRLFKMAMGLWGQYWGAGGSGLRWRQAETCRDQGGGRGRYGCGAAHIMGEGREGEEPACVRVS